MTEIRWIDNCKICNDGVCNQIDEYRSSGMSVRAASEKMARDCNGQFTADQIRGRWKFHAKGQGGRTSPRKMSSQETFVAMALDFPIYQNITPEDIDCAMKWKKLAWNTVLGLKP